ncbi:MAG: mycofactocin biosynthesis glycosyltransferase MftF [Thermoleophilia bacterium]|nr:mycofactocin biosynthesis glycosyltransferase MftF [Thermoleophilia bacterium]
MIPLAYRLRKGVRVEQAGGAWRAVCDLPLGVVKVNAAAARLLELTRDGSSVSELAAASGSDEERVLGLCEYFRHRGMLDVSPAGVAPLGIIPCPGDVRPDVSSGAGDPAPAPSVSVIVPAKDRAAELDACLAALFALDYPADRLEVIVVDDGSEDGTAGVAARYPCLCLANDRNRGQSYSRNAGARRATGEILAFIDSDCVADPGWLRELVPFFAWPRVAAIGGYVAGHHDQTRLDRYEQAASSLNMGERLILAGDDPSSFYVPTCNLLVRREAYLAAGGLREDLRVGEDVDLCWRLRRTGSYLVYSPSGRVLHRHRSRLPQMLRRRAQYGTSEAVLQALHPEKRKTFAVRAPPLLTFGLLGAALAAAEPRLLPFCLLPPVVGGCAAGYGWRGRTPASARAASGWRSPAGTCRSSTPPSSISSATTCWCS